LSSIRILETDDNFQNCLLRLYFNLSAPDTKIHPTRKACLFWILFVLMLSCVVSALSDVARGQFKCRADPRRADPTRLGGHGALKSRWAVGIDSYYAGKSKEVMLRTDPAFVRNTDNL